MLDFEEGNIRRNSPKERQEKRIRDRKLYYGKLMPFIYARFFGLLGLFRVILARTISLFRPMMLEVSECDMRVTVNMVIPCCIRDWNKGIWGERGRVPFDEIYHRI